MRRRSISKPDDLRFARRFGAEIRRIFESLSGRTRRKSRSRGRRTKKKLCRKSKKASSLNLNKITPEQHFTEPPPRYTEATLVKVLEEKGIGRPSTYAAIMTTIQDREYVEKLEGRFHPTALGTTVNDVLVAGFTIFSTQLTRRGWKKNLMRSRKENSTGATLCAIFTTNFPLI